MQATTNPIANRAEEQQLLHSLAAGETRAFWQLFQQCRDYLFRYCLKWTNNRERDRPSSRKSGDRELGNPLSLALSKAEFIGCLLNPLLINPIQEDRDMGKKKLIF